MKKIGLLILILALGACADISGRSWWSGLQLIRLSFMTAASIWSIPNMLVKKALKATKF